MVSQCMSMWLSLNGVRSVLLQQYSWLMTVIYVRNADDTLLEEVLRQAGIPLLRSHDARKLLQMTEEWLNKTQVSEMRRPHSLIH